MFTRDRSFYMDFIKLCTALMLEQAVILSVNLVDNLMLGAYSESALSGVAAVNQIQFVFQQMVYAAGTSLIVLGSQYWSQGRIKEIRSLTALCGWSGVFIALVLFVIVSFFPYQTMKCFTDDTDIACEGVQYLDIIRFTYLFFALTNGMLSAMRIAKSVNIALRVSIISMLINIAINWLLIFGKLGMPEMGARGAAIGTLVARIVECFIVTKHLFTREKDLDIRPSDFLHLDKSLLHDYIRVGTPVLIAQTLWGLNNVVQTIILGHMSASAIAAQSISSTLFLLLKVAAVGAASAAAVLIGQAVGQGNMQKIREYTKTLQMLFIAIGALMCIVMLLVRSVILSVYNVTEETQRIAEAYMLIQSFVLLTMSYQMSCTTGIIRGGGDTKYALCLDSISIWGIVIPISILGAFVFGWSEIAVIICLNADQVFKCVPAFFRVNSYKWVKKLTREAE